MRGGKEALQALEQIFPCSPWRGLLQGRYPCCGPWRTPRQSRWTFSEGIAACGDPTLEQVKSVRRKELQRGTDIY